MGRDEHPTLRRLHQTDQKGCGRVQKNAQAPGRVLPHRQGRLNRHPRLGGQAEEARQQGQGHLQATQVPPAQSVQQETPVVRQKAQWRSKSSIDFDGTAKVESTKTGKDKAEKKSKKTT